MLKKSVFNARASVKSVLIDIDLSLHVGNGYNWIISAKRYHIMC